MIVRMLLLALAAVLAVLPSAASADDNRPLIVAISAAEDAGDATGQFRARWKIPANVDQAHLPEIVPGQECMITGRQRNWSDPMGHWHEEVWNCAGPLSGQRLDIRYPVANPGLATIVRYTPVAGTEPLTVLLQPQETSFVLPSAEERSGVFAEFLALGVEHIWIGIDHLLFVAGLIFIAGSLRRVLVTITGFTAAHSITLAIAALGLVRLPIAAVEAAIALSIVFLAVEIVKGPRDTLTWRQPVVVASAFGLLHGFGFAAVLGEIGLPGDGLVLALLAFNLGVELGQVAFAALVMLALRGVAAIARRTGGHLPAAKFAGYLVGTVASFWMFERLLV
jgi:hypothetical protein